MLKNIIFDFGGVLFDIDYKLTEAGFKTLGFNDFEKMYNQFKANSLFSDLEKGNISEEDFYTEIKKVSSSPLENQDLAAAWNAMLLNFRPESFNYLKKLGEEYKLYLLSNTNRIHHNEFIQLTGQGKAVAPLEEYFDKVYYSFDIGMRKPDIEIFQYVLYDAGLKNNETLFIDDTTVNLEPAEALGIHTYLMKPTDKIENLDFEEIYRTSFTSS